MRALAKHSDIEVVCRDNLPVEPLRLSCAKYGVHYVANEKTQGFAANNNANFLYCREKLGMSDGDFFVLFNPDLYIVEKSISYAIDCLLKGKDDFYVPNLLLDKEELMQDDNIRTYPRLPDFVRTYCFNQRPTMVCRQNGLPVDKDYWASCALLAVRAGLFQKVGGLDERYYMYCEDIDLSYRLRLAGVRFTYLGNMKAIHLRRRDSKRFLTKYFWWHVASVFKYSFSRKEILARKSRILERAKIH